MTTDLTYSNPRTLATISDWPSGAKRVTATFEIEQTPQGERAMRTTTGKPVLRTYARKARIVDGSDGKTYIAELSKYCDHITIIQGNMKFQREVLYSSDPRYAAILALFPE